MSETARRPGWGWLSAVAAVACAQACGGVGSSAPSNDSGANGESGATSSSGASASGGSGSVGGSGASTSGSTGSGTSTSGGSTGSSGSTSGGSTGSSGSTSGGSTGSSGSTSSGASSSSGGSGSSASGSGASTSGSGASTSSSGGDSGAGSVARGAIIWRDATGAVVPFFLQFGFGGSAWTDEAGGMFLDSTGVMWSFGPVDCGGPLTICPPYAQYNNVPYPTYWDGANCTGTAYVPYVHGRIAFTLLGPSGSSVRALNSDAAVAMQFLQSSYGGAGSTGCSSSTIVHILAAPLTDAPVVMPPAQLPFTLPVHAEIVP